MRLFRNCYLADPQPNLGHSGVDSITNSMLVTAFSAIFDPRLGPITWTSAYWDSTKYAIYVLLQCKDGCLASNEFQREAFVEK